MKDNCLLVANRVVRIFALRYTKNYLKELVLSHPDYPSMLSIADSLEKYQISNVAIQIEDKGRICELP